MNIHTCIRPGEQYIQSQYVLFFIYKESRERAKRIQRAAGLSPVGLLGVGNDGKGTGREQVIENFVYHAQELYFV